MNYYFGTDQITNPLVISALEKLTPINSTILDDRKIADGEEGEKLTNIYPTDRLDTFADKNDLKEINKTLTRAQKPTLSEQEFATLAYALKTRFGSDPHKPYAISILEFKNPYEKQTAPASAPYSGAPTIYVFNAEDLKKHWICEGNAPKCIADKIAFIRRVLIVGISELHNYFTPGDFVSDVTKGFLPENVTLSIETKNKGEVKSFLLDEARQYLAEMLPNEGFWGNLSNNELKKLWGLLNDAEFVADTKNEAVSQLRKNDSFVFKLQIILA